MNESVPEPAEVDFSRQDTYYPRFVTDEDRQENKVEINPVRERIKDLQGRAQALRGYL